jgi:hypothetical protein
MREPLLFKVFKQNVFLQSFLLTYLSTIILKVCLLCTGHQNPYYFLLLTVKGFLNLLNIHTLFCFTNNLSIWSSKISYNIERFYENKARPIDIWQCLPKRLRDMTDQIRGSFSKGEKRATRYMLIVSLIKQLYMKLLLGFNSSSPNLKSLVGKYCISTDSVPSFISLS